MDSEEELFHDCPKCREAAQRKKELEEKNATVETKPLSFEEEGKVTDDFNEADQQTTVPNGEFELIRDEKDHICEEDVPTEVLDAVPNQRNEDESQEKDVLIEDLTSPQSVTEDDVISNDVEDDLSSSDAAKLRTINEKRVHFFDEPCEHNHQIENGQIEEKTLVDLPVVISEVEIDNQAVEQDETAVLNVNEENNFEDTTEDINNDDNVSKRDSQDVDELIEISSAEDVNQDEERSEFEETRDVSDVDNLVMENVVETTVQLTNQDNDTEIDVIEENVEQVEIQETVVCVEMQSEIKDDQDEPHNEVTTESVPQAEDYVEETCNSSTSADMGKDDVNNDDEVPENKHDESLEYIEPEPETLISKIELTEEDCPGEIVGNNEKLYTSEDDDREIEHSENDVILVNEQINRSDIETGIISENTYADVVQNNDEVELEPEVEIEQSQNEEIINNMEIEETKNEENNQMLSEQDDIVEETNNEETSTLVTESEIEKHLDNSEEITLQTIDYEIKEIDSMEDGCKDDNYDDSSSDVTIDLNSERGDLGDPDDVADVESHSQVKEVEDDFSHPEENHTNQDNDDVISVTIGSRASHEDVRPPENSPTFKVADSDPPDIPSAPIPNSSNSTRFIVFVVMPTRDVVSLRNVRSGITISQIKGYLELLSGIPSNIYSLERSVPNDRLAEDSKLILDPNAPMSCIMRMRLRPPWTKLFFMIWGNDVSFINRDNGEMLFNEEELKKGTYEQLRNIYRKRMFVALFISCFLGHKSSCEILLDTGVDINDSTDHGHSVVHVTAAQNHLPLLKFLIGKGAIYNSVSKFNKLPVDAARESDAFNCERFLRLHRWSLTGHKIDLAMESKLDNVSRFPRPSTAHSASTVRNQEKYLNRPKTSASVGKGPDFIGISRSSTGKLQTHAEKKLPLRCKSAPAKSFRKADIPFGFKDDKSKYHCSCSKGTEFITKYDVPAERQYSSTVEYLRQPNPRHAELLRRAAALEAREENNKYNGTNPFGKCIPSMTITETLPDAENVTSNAKRSSSAKSSNFRNTPRIRTKSASSSTAGSETLMPFERNVKLCKQTGIDFEFDAERAVRNRIAYKKWLSKKSLAESDSGSESGDEATENRQQKYSVEENEEAFTKWVTEKQNRPKEDSKVRRYKSQREKFENVFILGSDDPTEPYYQNPLEYHVSHKEYKRSKLTQKVADNEKRKMNINELRKKVREGRSRTILEGKLYEDWLDDIAAQENLRKRERRLKLREEEMAIRESHESKMGRHLGHEKWASRVNKRETAKKLRETREEEMNSKKMKEVREKLYENVPSFEEWKRKKAQLNASTNAVIDYTTLKLQEARKMEEAENAYNKWLTRKDEQDLNAIRQKIKLIDTR